MFLSLQHFVKRVNLNVSTMNVCPVSSGVMGRQTAVTAQMNGTVVGFFCGALCLEVIFGYYSLKKVLFCKEK